MAERRDTLASAMRLATLTGLLLVVGSSARASGDDYEIGSGDVLHVIVLGQDAMSGEFAVDENGIMTFPFLGSVKASAMSTPELERKLATLLSGGYLKRPQVSVAVKHYRSRRVYVTGEVARPGPYGLRPDRSLLTLLGDVGELTQSVGHEIVVIRPPANPQPQQQPMGDDGPGPEPVPTPSPRQGPALPGEVPGALVFRVNLRELRAGYPGKDLPLEVGDTVYFPKAAQVYLTGHVARPGVYRFEEDLTVFKALALAGSATDRGSAKRVRIIRNVEGKRKEFRAKLTDPVLPEDTIHVPERFF